MSASNQGSFLQDFNEMEVQLYKHLRRARKALNLQTIISLTGMKKKTILNSIKKFNFLGLIYSPSRNNFALQGKYHGDPLLMYEYEALTELEHILGESIPQIEKVDLNFGYVSDNFRVLELGLYKKNIEELPHSIGKLKQLRILDLGYNKLKKLPLELRNLVGITRLNLMFNLFTEIPLMIRKMVTLRELEFQGNKLTELPPWINKLTFMSGMDFGHNNLEHLHENIGKHPKLNYLDLWNNKLTELPDSICQLKELKLLGLSRNQLVSLPESIGSLSNLTSLGLDSNQIDAFPESICKLTHLEKLDISYNPLTSNSDKVKKWLNNLIVGEKCQLTNVHEASSQDEG
ncbi:leucine-rich repeat domain-containing protein [Candidatus Lokiarchaeum ossiferum]|uniref:leucine-rich repeat domain-containing protein n=1 Tax=Candidatus Lokiarchaeum ossiferum TaxID=2951803 RepID=UPI00352FB0CB